MWDAPIVNSSTKKFCQRGIIWLWLSALLIIVDQTVKYWMVEHLTMYEPLSLLPFLNLTLAHNTGAAFSFLHNASGWQNLFLGGIAAGISFFILYWLYQLSAQAYSTNIALTLILGGALGNALDRILNGYVIDFIDFHLYTWHFAIFNIADSAISVGSFILIVHWLFFQKTNSEYL